MNLVASTIIRIAAWVAILGVPVASWSFARVAVVLARGLQAGLWDVADAVVIGAAGVGSIATALLTSATAATLVASRGREARLPSRLVDATPRAWRRVIAVATGAALAGGFAAPALATEPSPGWVTPAPIESTGPELAATEVSGFTISDEPSAVAVPDVTTLAPQALSPAWASAPDAGWETPWPSGGTTPATTAPPPTAPPDAAPPLAAATTREGVDVHVVVAGESLWSISAAALGDAASVAQVDAAWRSLYAANADAIGNNPNLIHPDLALSLPKGLLP